jgi:hypothetical protein
MEWIKYPYGLNSFSNYSLALKVNEDGSFAIYYSIGAPAQNFFGSLKRYDTLGDLISSKDYTNKFRYVYAHPSDSLFSGISDNSSLYEMQATGNFQERTEVAETDLSNVKITNYIPMRDGGYLGVGRYDYTSIYTGMFYIARFGANGSCHLEDFPESVKVFPNPTSDGNITLALDTKAGDGVFIRITSSDGKLIYMNAFYCPADSHTDLPLQLDNTFTNAGIYFLEVRTGDMVVRKKIMVMQHQ